MKPVPNPHNVRIECPCGWSRMLSEADNPEQAARYHRIQVHNDQDAVKAARTY